MVEINKSGFNSVFYIVQTAPVFKTCGYTFEKSIAKKVAKVIQKYTGTPGRIVEFSREELDKLAFPSRN